MNNGPMGKDERTKWEAIRDAIHELSEDGEGGLRGEVIKRASIRAGEHKREIELTIEDMEQRGEIYQVGERLKDTNAFLRGEHP